MPFVIIMIGVFPSNSLFMIDSWSDKANFAIKNALFDIFPTIKIDILFLKNWYKMSSFKVAKLHPDAVIPLRCSYRAAGFDLSSCVDGILPARSWKMFDTGIAIEIPEECNCYARVAPRSGLALKKGIMTGAGVVDADYRNTIGVILFNHNDEDFEVKKGDRIAQLIFEKIYTPLLEVIEADELSETERGMKGFGSTGI
jgi:deoxyuridine 5'-triphosphate nucleotidohydrolase